MSYNKQEIYMQRALDLAVSGFGKTKTNPMVGCVLEHNGEVVREGFHTAFGQPHAEVECLKDWKMKDSDSSSCLYVTLEPCAHQGKTPPCVDLILAKNIKKVVVGMVDPNPKVAGKSIKKLREHGVEVEVGVLEADCRELNRDFIINQKYDRPYIILKWAQTADGFVARNNFDSKWISSKYGRTLVHKMRSGVDAILVGKNTALHDNPLLTTRLWSGEDPIRVFLDKNLEVPTSHHLFDGKVKTICYNQEREDTDKVEFRKFDFELFDLNFLLDDLYISGIGSVLVEGGSATLQQFLTSGLWDEIQIFESEKVFGSGISAPAVQFPLNQEFKFEMDRLKVYRNGAWI